MELAQEPGAREVPVALDRRDGDLKGFRRLALGEPAEVPQLNDLRRSGIERAEALQRLVDCQQVYRIESVIARVGAGKRLFVKASPSFGRPHTSRVVHQHAAHLLREYGKKMATVLPVDVSAPAEPKIRLVDKAGRRESVFGTLAAHVARRQLAKFGVDHGQQFVPGLFVSGAPAGEENRHAWRIGAHS